MDSPNFREGFHGSKPLALRSSFYRWKALDEGYNFSLNFIAIKGLHKKL
jgi:hypothetical protein